LDLPEDSMVVIPNGIDNEEIRALAARTADHPWFLDGSIPVLISIGRLVEQKGFDDLLNALQIVLRSTPVRLILLGEGPKRKALETLARDLNLGQYIDFHGFVANPYTFVKQSSLYVLSSRYEGFGIVILESLALGVPVISTDCPSGPGELLEGGLWGNLIPPGQPKVLASAILSLLGDPDRMDYLSQMGPDRAQAFEIEIIASKYIELFHRGELS